MEGKGKNINVNKRIFNNLITTVTSLTDKLQGLSEHTDEEIRTIRKDIYDLGADILYLRDLRDKAYQDYIKAKKSNATEEEISRLFQIYNTYKNTYNEIKQNREL